MFELKVHFSTDGAAFDCGNKCPYENPEILYQMNRVFQRFKDGETEGSVIDTWGNKCGEWSVSY